MKGLMTVRFGGAMVCPVRPGRPRIVHEVKAELRDQLQLAHRPSATMRSTPRQRASNAAMTPVIAA
jgi:hypothetical protein